MTGNNNGNGNSLNGLDIRDAGLPARAINALTNAGKFKTLGELVKANDGELLDVPKMGQKTVEAIRARIADLRLKVAEPYSQEAVSGSEPRARQPVLETGAELEWAKTHSNLIRAIQAGEVIIRVRA